MNKRKMRFRPFRMLACCLAAITLVLLVRFPGKAVSLQNQQQQLAAAMSAYYDAQSRHNQLTTELAEIDTDDFIERTARREYGYCWYGETIYEVVNLDAVQDAVQEAAGFELYTQGAPEMPAVQAVEGEHSA